MASAFGFDEFELDSEKLVLTRSGEPVRVDTQTVRILEYFLRRPGKLITKQELTSAVWEGRAISESALTVAIARLRRVLGSGARASKAVITVHGRGYRFVRPVVARESVSDVRVGGEQGLSRASLPFVGRERVLSQLHTALNDARAQHGQIVVLRGEAGIGKTRTAEMLARAQIPVAFGYCREAGDTPPLWPFAQLVRDLVEELSLVDEVQKRIPSLAWLLPELSTQSPHATHESAGASQRRHKHVVFDGVMRFLALVSDLSPCLLVLDDIHRADEATLELMRYLSDEIARTRVLLVATLRDHEAHDNQQLARILGHRNCSVIPLQRLSEADVQSYVETILGRPEPAWSRTLFEKSEGNPFFMSQLAWSMSQDTRADPAALVVPRVALDIVRQRIAQLAEAARDILCEAAVIGRSFSLTLLLQVSGRPIAELTSSLDDACANGLVLQRGDSVTDFMFSHELLREVLYEDLAKAKRRELHLKVASALEVRAADGQSIPPSDLAYHFRSAVPAGDPRKVVEYCIKAASAAADMFAYADGARFFGHAREALELLDSPSPRMRIGLALRQALLVRAYSTAQFVPLIRNVIQLARAQKMVVPLVRATMLLDPYPGFEPIAGSFEALSAALELLPADAPSFRAALLARQAISAPLLFDAAASEQQLTAAEALANDSPEVGDRYNTLLSRLYLSGGPRPDARATAADEALSVMFCEHAGLMTVPPILLEIHRAIRALQSGDRSTMDRALERGEVRSRVLDSELHWHLQRFRALARIDAGQQAEGSAGLARLHAHAREHAVAGAKLLCSFDQSIVLPDANAPPDARSGAELDLQSDDPPGIWSIKVRVLAAAGLFERARAALVRVPAARLAALPRDRDYLGTLGTLARAAVALDQRAYCAVLFDLLEPHRGGFAAHLAFACEGSVSQLLGVLARALGRPDAREYFAAGLAECERAGLVRCAAECRLQLALE